jgi:hypothetical protein
VVCSDTSLKVNSLDILADYEFVSCLKDMARSVSVVLLRCLVFVWLVEGSVLRSCLLAIWNDCRVSAPGSVKLGNRPVFALGQLYLWWGRAGNPHGCCLIRSACQRCFGQRNAWERERERASAPIFRPSRPQPCLSVPLLLLLIIHANNTRKGICASLPFTLPVPAHCANYHRYSPSNDIPVPPSTQLAAFHCLPTVSTHLDYCHAPCPRRAIIPGEMEADWNEV